MLDINNESVESQVTAPTENDPREPMPANAFNFFQFAPALLHNDPNIIQADAHGVGEHGHIQNVVPLLIF